MGQDGDITANSFGKLLGLCTHKWRAHEPNTAQQGLTTISNAQCVKIRCSLELFIWKNTAIAPVSPAGCPVKTSAGISELRVFGVRHIKDRLVLLRLPNMEPCASLLNFSAVYRNAEIRRAMQDM